MPRKYSHIQEHENLQREFPQNLRDDPGKAKPENQALRNILRDYPIICVNLLRGVE